MDIAIKNQPAGTLEADLDTVLATKWQNRLSGAHPPNPAAAAHSIKIRGHAKNILGIFGQVGFSGVTPPMNIVKGGLWKKSVSIIPYDRKSACRTVKLEIKMKNPASNHRLPLNINAVAAWIRLRLASVRFHDKGGWRAIRLNVSAARRLNAARKVRMRKRMEVNRGEAGIEPAGLPGEAGLNKRVKTRFHPP